MLNPIPIYPQKFIDHLNDNNFDDFFGFCLANITAPNNLLNPILPYRDDDNHIIFP
jgi:hypothetical protein